MMKAYYVRLFLTLILSLSFSLSAQGQEKKPSDTVRIVGDIYYVPYQMLNDEGEPAGMVVDLMREVMHRMKKPYTISMMTKSKMLEAFNDHKSQVIAMGLIYAGDRDKTIKYGLSYRYVFENMICRKKESHLYNSVADMRGKRIMVEDGSYSEQLLRKMGFSKELMPVVNLKEAFIALSNKKCDVVFCPGEMAFYVIEELEMTDQLERKDASLDPLKYGMAGNDSLLLERIKTTVTGMKKDGTYDKIYNKWFYNTGHIRQYRRVLYYIGIIALVLVAFVFILKSKVKKVRKELDEKNVNLQNDADKMKFIFSSSGVEAWEFFPETQTCRWHSAKGSMDMECKIKLANVVDEKDRERMGEVISQMMERTVEKFSLTVKANGRDSYLKIEGTAVKDEAGNIMYYSGVSHDVTDLILVQNRLEEEKEKAQRADKLKSAFLKNMSHEIRTPLNSIIGFSQMLPIIEDEVTRQKVINIIMTNNDLLLHLINNILDLSKIEAGIIEIDNTEFNLSECIKTLADTFLYNAKPDSPKLILDLPQKTLIIKSDKRLLTQILFNLLVNAYKFTKKGSIKVSFHPEDDGVYISVEDTGIGIQREKFETIFNSFEKVDVFTQGVGLGLSICKANVNLLKGKIGLRSTFGVGSTFWIWLPLK